MHPFASNELTARPRGGQGHTDLAGHVVEALACQGIHSEVVGNDAAAVIRIKDGVGSYGFVCSDLPRRGRSGGWTVLEWIRTRGPGLPVALVSGAGRGMFLCDATQHGVIAAFRRPFGFWEVQQTLAEVLPYL